MSFQIERGLFKFDFTDYHAILGLPVDAAEKEIRSRYLKVARKLHPDSCKASSEAEKKQASQLLSKLVNPAYEHLYQNNRDYTVSLNHLARRLAAEGGQISIASEAAKQLARSGGNLDGAYKSLLQSLASQQYESLDQVLEKIAEISELNLVYLMLKGKGEGVKAAPRTTSVTTSSPVHPPAPTSRPVATAGSNSSSAADSQSRSQIEAYIRRAEGYMAKDKNNFAAAILELREALKMDQTNSSCHSLLGIAYLKQNQPGMAKVHINKALQLNPQDERALQGKQYLERLTQKNAGGTSQKSGGSKQSDKSGDRKFWPFGGKSK